MKPGWEKLELNNEFFIFRMQLPGVLTPDETHFEQLWDLHPEEFHDVKIMDKVVKTPRWQQAYNKSYEYTGSVNVALRVPELLQPYWDWCREHIDGRLNALLLNWYDGKLGHYIGKHRDSVTNMIDGAPIVTVSFGEERKFRFRPWRGTGFTDFVTTNGSVFIVPYATNLAWTHEVPASKKFQGRRISLTVRAFE